MTVIHVIITVMTADGLTVRGDGAPPIRRVPLALARRFFQICNTASANSVAAAGLTPLEFAVLAYVNSIDGDPNIDQSGLAARLGVDRNTTSLLVRGLEKRGLLDQRVNEADRRVRLIRLTDAGEALFARLHPPALAAQHEILTALDPAERELLLDLLLRVIDENRHLARPGAGRRKRSTKASRLANGQAA
jgi:MarR family transcriptional regulator, lower aerobic nicotinate degradation pathway regulator